MKLSKHFISKDMSNSSTLAQMIIISIDLLIDRSFNNIKKKVLRNVPVWEICKIYQ